MKLLELLGFCDGKRWSSISSSGPAGPEDTGNGSGGNSKGSGGGNSCAGAHEEHETTVPGHEWRESAASSSSHNVRCFRNEELQRCMVAVSGTVKPWDTGMFRLVGKLQDAVRNKGRVDEMRRSGPDGDRRVAVKRMPSSWVTRGPEEFDKQYPTAPERPWCDIAIVRELNRLGFTYVCEFMGVFRDREYTYVVAELATRGDLFGWCDLDPPPGVAREAKMQPLMVQIFSAVKWLHELGVAHRDLSLENILLTDVGGDLQIKVIDFGMCTASQTAQCEVRGKQSYQAPEMHAGNTYDTYLTDTFALGVTLFAMAAQDYPWTSTKRNACQLHEYVCTFGFRKFLEKRKLRKGRGEYLLDVFSPSLVDLLEGVLQRQPRTRTSLGESCFSDSVTGKDRSSVWDMPWMKTAKPKNDI
mmetsp:Transcript_15573/g.21001  ORF Transcript_15573/g.21001 Transcript_15573/m.21001 type:complete len:414 (-) Transcript_15573:138-1379(-)